MELNEKIVVGLSDLFNTDKETVTEALTNAEAEGSFIDDWKSANVIKSKNDFETFQANLVLDTKTNHIAELKEKAKSKELPQELYSFFKGNVTEELEKKLSRASNIGEYDGFDDLVGKVISSKSQDETLKGQIAELQHRNTDLQNEKENAVNEAQQNFDSELIKFDKDKVYKSLDLDYSDEAKPKQLQLLESQVDRNYKLSRVDGKTIVSDTDGNVFKNKNTLEPLTLSEVVLKVAKEFDFKLKSPESGGQGGKSSQQTTVAGTWEDHAKANNITIGTREADKAYIDWKNLNK